MPVANKLRNAALAEADSVDDSDLPGKSSPYNFRIANPQPLFALLAVWLAPLGILRHLVIPSAFVAAFSASFNSADLMAHLDRVTGTMEFWQSFVLGLLTANLLGKVAQGVAMAGHGLACNEFGIRLSMGFIPRFYINSRAIRGADSLTQRACYAAPLLMRLLMYSVGTLVWTVLLRTGSGLADLAVALSAVGLGSFLFTANPLWPADGYRWLSARLERPRLRQHSLKLLGLVLRLKPIPRDLPRSEFWALLVFAVASIGFTAATAWLILSGVAFMLESQLRGTGIVIFCVLLAAVGLYLVSLVSNKRVRAARGSRLQDQVSRSAPSRSMAARARNAGPKTTGADLMSSEGDLMAERRQRAQAVWRTASTNATPTPPPAEGGADDALAALLGDVSVWGEPAATAPHRPARPIVPETSVGPDPSLDDLFALPPQPPNTPAEDLTDDELDDVLALAFAPDGPGEAVPARPREDAAIAAAGILPAQPAVEGSGAGPARPGLPARRASASNAVEPVPQAPAPPRGRAMEDLDRLLQVGTARPDSGSRWRALLVWAVLLGALAYVAFLPYAFEAGGEFVVQPLDRAEVRSRTDGEIVEVNVDEGDWVEAGQIMAVLSNWDEQRDISLQEADGAKLRAELAALTEGASPEEVAVAQRALDTAEVQVQATAEDLSRQEALFANGTIAEAAVMQARTANAVAVSNRDEAAAKLALVAAPTRETEIQGLRAEIARNEDELEFARLMLENTNIRAPVAGQVVSSLIEAPLGAYLPSGGLFAELEDNRTVIADVEIPEITINEVEIGAPAELRLWSDPETSLSGTVRSISPVAEERDFGKVIRVQVEVPNPDGRLAANMTGFGKIEAEERPVWQAFGRAIYRFFVIELWSWLP